MTPDVRPDDKALPADMETGAEHLHGAKSQFRYLLLAGCVAALSLAGARAFVSGMRPTHPSAPYRKAIRAVETQLVAEHRAWLEHEQDAQHKDDDTRDGPRVLEQQDGRASFAHQTRERGRLVASARTACAARPHPLMSPQSPDDLPRLTQSTVRALFAEDRLSIHRVTADLRLVGETLTGLIVVSPGAKLVLRDVHLRGAIVSAAAMSTGPLIGLDETVAPIVEVTGSLRIDPLRALPGLAVVLPDGIFLAGGEDASLQIRGDVVARRVVLAGRGSLDGQIASLEPAQVDEAIERLGMGRAPRRWSTALDLAGPRAAETFAHAASTVRWRDVRPMLRFEFP